jgi:hypothetical protein
MAVPSSIKLQEEYGDKIQVIFASGSDTPEAVQAFALGKKWLGGRAMWTSEPPFETGLEYIPAAVLLDSSGAVKIIDNPIEVHKKICDLIDADLDAAKKGPKNAPDAVRKAWQDFNSGNAAKALAAAQALVDKPPAKDAEAVVAAAKSALESFNKSLDARFAAADSLLASGLYDRAQAELDALTKTTKGNADLAKRIADFQTRLNDPALKSERDAAADLARIEKKLYDKGIEDNSAKSLTAWAEKHSGTLAATRAEQLARLCELAATQK